MARLNCREPLWFNGAASQASCGPLAQLVEQWTLNPLVIGSIPIRPTIFPSLLVRHAPDPPISPMKIGGYNLFGFTCIIRRIR